MLYKVTSLFLFTFVSWTVSAGELPKTVVVRSGPDHSMEFYSSDIRPGDIQVNQISGWTQVPQVDANTDLSMTLSHVDALGEGPHVDHGDRGHHPGWGRSPYWGPYSGGYYPYNPYYYAYPNPYSYSYPYYYNGGYYPYGYCGYQWVAPYGYTYYCM